MSYDLMAFEIFKAPKDKEEFFKWYDKQSEWEEDHDYDDINCLLYTSPSPRD